MWNRPSENKYLPAGEYLLIRARVSKLAKRAGLKIRSRRCTWVRIPPLALGLKNFYSRRYASNPGEEMYTILSRTGKPGDAAAIKKSYTAAFSGTFEQKSSTPFGVHTPI
jgi:hypothetical protein